MNALENLSYNNLHLINWINKFNLNVFYLPNNNTMIDTMYVCRNLKKQLSNLNCIYVRSVGVNVKRDNL